MGGSLLELRHLRLLDPDLLQLLRRGVPDGVHGLLLPRGAPELLGRLPRPGAPPSFFHEWRPVERVSPSIEGRRKVAANPHEWAVRFTSGWDACAGVCLVRPRRAVWPAPVDALFVAKLEQAVEVSQRLRRLNWCQWRQRQLR